MRPARLIPADHLLFPSPVCHRPPNVSEPLVPPAMSSILLNLVARRHDTMPAPTEAEAAAYIARNQVSVLFTISSQARG